MKKQILCLLMALILCLPAYAETAAPQSEIDALNARIAELEAQVADLQAQLAEYQPAYDPDADVITFDGGSVKLGVAMEQYEEMAALYEEFGMSAAEYADELKSSILDNLAEDAILLAKAKELGVYENTPEQQAAAEEEARLSYEANMSYYMAYFTDESLAEDEIRAHTADYMASQGITYEGMLEDTLRMQWNDRLYGAVTADIAITEDDLTELYENGLSDAMALYADDPEMFEYDSVSGELIFYRPEGYREVQYLLLPFSDEEYAMKDSAEQLQSLSDRYEDVINRAQNGEDLIALAEEIGSYDSGVLPVCETSTMMGDVFRDAALSLSAEGLDQTSLPVIDVDGAWIIRNMGEIEPGEVPYDEMRDILSEAALESARLDFFYTQIETWMNEANLVLHPELIP